MLDLSFRTGVLCAFLAAVLFGMISVVAKPTVAAVNPILLSAFVYLIGAATMTGIAGVRFPRVGKRHYLLLVASGISGGVIAPLLYFFGLSQTTASDTSVISNSEIVFSIILAILFFREKVKRRGYLAMLLVFAGIFLVATDLRFSGSAFDLNVGNMLILASSVFWGIDNNISRMLTKRFENSAKIAQLKSAIGGGILFCIVLAMQIPIMADASQIPSIILLGAGGFAASLFFFLSALRRIGTVKTILIFSLFSPIGLAASAVFLHEEIGMYQIAATVMMILGIYLVLKTTKQT
ncbi:DMT family transporter [Candidatus Nitrosotenuis cloacae]|uniref:DMT family transporter n=1 Tax=Candidatus Nitrosotenuis cloacae TaxID=1603555 RepID=UPI002282D65D|nr:DMT family transporter [Candidatus Nitrosotenuis cloacae]